MTAPSSSRGDSGSPLVIAHRGASKVAPENTAASIREALRMGAPVIEFDVRATRDGKLVLFHDDKLDRLAGRPGTIESSDWSAVKTLDVGAWFEGGAFTGEVVPDFEEAIRLCLEGGATPLIEHKTGEAKAYAEVIRRLDAADRVIVQSFNWKFLRDLRRELPGTPLGALGSAVLTPEKQAQLLELRPDWIGWGIKDLAPADLPRLRECGARLALWTVNDPAAAKRWVAAGVNAIITDVPDLVAAALAEP